ncbi:MAG: hypothetical protein GC157_07210 [Frankiales bacterium]|nr:hypothetical protein [Frankiales bacterium]
MATLVTVIPGSVIASTQLARLVCPGVGTLVLPWWPSEVEHSEWAPEYAETPRPGRTMVQTRSSDPLPQLRLAFTLRTTNPSESIDEQLTLVRRLAAAKPVVQLLLGPSDRGRWRIREAGAVESDWADDGTASIADVSLTLRRESDAAIPVGPIRKKPKRKK